MIKLLPYIKKYRIEAILGPVFKLVEAMFELFVPLVVANIIDVGIAGNNKSYIISHGLLMAVLGVIGFICAVTAQFFAAKASVGFATNLRHSLFKRINEFGFADLDSIGSSTLITRMTADINQIQTGVNLTLRLLLRSPFIVFGAMIMAFTVDSVSALIFVAAIPVLTVIVVTAMWITIPLYKKVQSRLDKVTLRTRETLKGVRVIRAFGIENKETEKFNADNDLLTVAQIAAGKISAFINPLTYLAVNAAVIAIIWIGGNRVYDGNLSQGQVVALYNYMSQILVELIKLANMIITVNKSLASASRVEAIINSENIKEKISEAKNLCDNKSFIVFDNVSFIYNGSSVESLVDISFSAKRGEHIGIIGPTGSGKSTLVNLIPHFYTATKGGVYIDGKNVALADERKLRKKIGTVMQKSVLFKGSVRDNLLLGGKTANDNELIDALITAQAMETVTNKGGLDAPVEQGGRNLSGGQKQRLTIARALVGKPEIIILDDSCSALDFATEAALRKAVSNLSTNPTVFTVSQRVSSVMNADKIIVLDDGKAVGIGTHRELLQYCDVYKEICSSQLSEEEM